MTIKKLSISNAFTILKSHIPLPFNNLEIKADISNYDFGKDNYCSYNFFDDDMKNKNLRQSRSDYQEILTAPELSQVEMNLLNEVKPAIIEGLTSKNMNENYDQKMSSSDYFSLGKTFIFKKRM